MTQAQQIEQGFRAPGFDDFIQEEASILNRLNEQRREALMAYSKSFLDKVFPLESGSHQDVTSYVVYYSHLLAFFADGSKSGLESSKQFVALSGHKSEPSSLLLQEGGFHVELRFDKNGPRGLKDLAGIDDIQVETTKALYAEHAASNDGANNGYSDEDKLGRHWVSLIRQGDDEHEVLSQVLTQGLTTSAKKAFTGKDGQEYPLS